MKLTQILTGMRVARLFRVIMVLAILSTISVQSAFSQDINAPQVLPTWTKYSVDAPPYYLNMRDRSLAFHPLTGIPCMAYGGDALYFSCWNPTTQGWDTTVVDAGLSVGQYTAMAFDNYYRPFITYYDAWNARLKLAYLNAGIWNIIVVPNFEPPAAPETEQTAPAEPAASAVTETPAEPQEPSTLERIEEFLKSNPTAEEIPTPNFQIGTAIGYGKFSSIAIDRNNAIHISYYDEIRGALDYQYWNGITFDGKQVQDYSDQGRVGLWTSIAVDFDFRVHIAYMSEKYDDLMYASRRPLGTWVVETVDAPDNVGSFASIALDSDYRPHISYYDFTNHRLKHAWRNLNGVWAKETVDSVDYAGWFTSIAIDSADRIHISYMNADSGNLRYARYANNVWSLGTLDKSGPAKEGMFTSIAIDVHGQPGIFYTNGGIGAVKYIYRPKDESWSDPSFVNYYFRDVGQATSLAVNTAGVPFVSYLDATVGKLKHARSYGSVWYRNFVRTDDLNTGLFSSIDLSGELTPHIAYYEQNNGNLWFSSWTGSSWTYSKVDQANDVGKYVSLAIDSTNLPHMSYYDATNGDLLYASYNTVASQWYTDTVDFEDNTGLFTSITLNAANLPFISYYEKTGGSLKIAYRSPATLTWVREIIDNVGQQTDIEVGAFSSIALDSAGRPNISYYDMVNKDLRYAYWDGVWGGPGSWNVTVLDSVGDVGKYTSLVIDQATDTRHLCYYDFTNGNLKYAQKVGAAAWEFQIVDGDVTDGDGINEGDVGYYCSIDINGLGQPAISYYDNSHGDLKVALSYPLPAMPTPSIYLPIVHR